MTDPYEEWSDYYETVVLRCNKPLCHWQREIDWLDFYGPDSNARRLYMEHFTEMHGDPDATDSGRPQTLGERHVQHYQSFALLEAGEDR